MDRLIQRILDPGVISLVITFHAHLEIPLRQFLQDLVSLVHRLDHCIQGLVKSFHNRPVTAFEMIGVAA